MEQRLLCFLAGKAKELRAYTTIVLDQQGAHGATCGPTAVPGLLVHRHRAEPVRGSTELLTSLRHLPSCWTSVGFYGTTYASGVFPPISIVSSFAFYFPSHFEGAFLCFPGSEVRPWLVNYQFRFWANYRKLPEVVLSNKSMVVGTFFSPAFFF